MKTKGIAILLLISIGGICGFAQIPEKKSFKYELGVRSDNDAYLAVGQDKYYTNGLFITFRKAMDQRALSPKLNKRLWEIELGQEIFNPQSGYISSPVYIDRPFAGYLYAGGSLVWLYNSENTLKTSLQIGTIGPSSLADRAQTLLHRMMGFYEIKGWQYQINNEFSVKTTVEYNHFLLRSLSKSTDFTWASYLNIGNTFTGIGTGLLFRWGTINSLYYSVSTTSRIANHAKEKDTSSNEEFFFYAKPMMHFRAYDATVEGGLFARDKGPIVFDIKPIVISGELGAAYAKNRWTATFSVIFKSKEIKSFVKPDQYGSIAICYRFN
jgi:hypothetical protein